MGIVDRAPRLRLARTWPPATAVVAVLLLVLAGPAAASEGPTKLLNGSVSPRTGVATTTIAFSVTYRNREGSDPDYVRVLIDGQAHAMTPASASTNYKIGVSFRYSTKLAVGTHSVSFSAMDRDRFSASLNGGTVTISQATSGSGGSTSTSGSSTTSGSTSDSGAGSGSAGSTTTDGTAGSTSTGTGSSGSTTTSSTSASPDQPVAPGVLAEGPLAEPEGVPAASRGSESWALDEASPGLLADAVSGISSTQEVGSEGDVSAEGWTRGAGPSAGGSNAAPAGLELLGVGGSLFDRSFRALPVMVTTTGTVIVWAAFFTFGKKRRDGQPPAPDEVLAAHAASGMDARPAADLAAPGHGHLPPGVDPIEAGMPRWRRPSLLEARKNDPIRNGSTVVNLTFAQGVVGPIEGKECRQIRYRLVRLMDVPDEVRANEIGILDQGDEVQLLEKSGTYWLVLCPDGRQGWLHQMVLGDVVVDDDDDPDDLPAGIDEDVLSAFLTSREKTA